jgi:hypothetical protein
MPLPQLVREIAERKINEYCNNKIPEDVKDKIRLTYKIRGNSITIYENRPPWDGSMREWTSLAVAQIRYDEKTGKWGLYWADRNDRWHEYWDINPTKKIEAILKEIDEDPTGIFWG